MFTAAPPASVAAVLAALDIIESRPERRDRLWENTRCAHGAPRHRIRLRRVVDAVIPIVVGPDEARSGWRSARERGRLRERRRSPLAPGRALIRTSYMAAREHHARSRRSNKVGKQLGVVS